MKKQNKKGMVQNETALWILGIILLVTVALIVFFLSGKGQELLQKIFEMLRFG